MSLATDPRRPDRCELAPEQLTITMTAHAIERFRDRARPTLDLPRAAEELQRLIAHGHVCSEAPPWIADRQHQHAAFYLVVGDLVFPLDSSRRDPATLSLLTCLARGAISPAARQRRNPRATNRAHARGKLRA